MRVGPWLTLIAVGLILTYAVQVTVPGIDLGALGSILFLVGLAGLAISIGVLVWEERSRRPRPPEPPRRAPERQPAPTRYDPVIGPPRSRPRDPDPADARTRALDDRR